MALPGPISGVPPEAANSFMGPVADSNGNLYYVLEEYLADGNHPMVMKSTDGGQTWTRQDVANNPTGSGAYNDMESAWVALRPTAKELVLCYMKAQSRWWGMSFRTSDHATNPDTWDTGTFATSSGQDQFGTQASESGIACCVLSDGTVRAFIRSGQGFLHRTKATTSWDTGATNITHSGVNMSRPACVVGESDTTHLFYRDHTNGRVYHRTISSTGTVGDPTRVDTNGAGTGDSYENNVIPPVYYDDAGDEVVVVGFVNASNVLRTVEVRNGTPGSEQVVSTDTVTVNPTGTTNQGPSAALAVHGTTVYAVWGDATSGDLYYASRANGGSWSSRTLLTDTGTGGSVQWLCAKVLDHGGGPVLAAVYDVGPHDDEDVSTEYNELILQTPLTVSRTDATGLADSVTFYRSDVRPTDTVALTDSTSRTLGTRVTYRCDVGVG